MTYSLSQFKDIQVRAIGIKPENKSFKDGLKEQTK